MSRRLPALLAILAVLFVVLVGWLGSRLAFEDVRSLETERRSVVESRLMEVSERAESVLHAVSQDVIRAADTTLMEGGSLRELGAHHPYVARYFEIERGKLRYPSGAAGESAAERDFHEMLRPLVQSGQLAGAVAEKQAGAPAPRWHSFNWRDGLHLLLLVERGGVTAGFEVHKARLLSDIVVTLERQPVRPPLNGALELRTDDGAVLFRAGAQTKSPGIRRELSLNHPLQGFKVSAEVPPAASGIRAPLFNATAGLVLLAVTIMLIVAAVLREQRRELREAEERLTFVGKVSHELRTPLTSIRLYAELLRERLDDEPSAAEHIDVIVRESERLSRLIGNVLRFGESERRTLSVKPSPGDVGATVSAVVDFYRPSFGSHGMTVTYSPSLRQPERVFDRDAITQIVHNVLSNCEKYARQGSVRIEMREQGDDIALEIYDEGPGIADGLEEKVFEPFFRVSSSLTDGVAGTGIGLGIARELARLHGGDLIILPTERGLGLRLTFRAPAAMNAPGA